MGIIITFEFGNVVLVAVSTRLYSIYGIIENVSGRHNGTTEGGYSLRSYLYFIIRCKEYYDFD